MLYDVIYTDPPWRYNFSSTQNRKIENHYRTMSFEDIAKLVIPANKDSVMYMWATAPKLIIALDVMKAWGFTYKTHAIWDKELIGMGYWFRGQHELLLVGTKGCFHPPPQSLRVSSVIRNLKRSKHSVKPDHVRDMISLWYPTASKLEMFARKKTEGWDVWGDEIC